MVEANIEVKERERETAKKIKSIGMSKVETETSARNAHIINICCFAHK